MFDTAPKVLTLPLSKLPDVLTGLLVTIVSIKSKLADVMRSLKAMFGSDVHVERYVEAIEELRMLINMEREMFKDEVQTVFIVESNRSMMAIAKSLVLAENLCNEDISVRHMFFNKVQPDNEDCLFYSMGHK